MDKNLFHIPPCAGCAEKDADDARDSVFCIGNTGWIFTQNNAVWETQPEDVRGARYETGSQNSRSAAEWKMSVMMLYPAMSILNSHIPNRYMLVNVVARRARQIADGYEHAHQPLNEKPVTLAIHEVAEGALDLNGMEIEHA